MTSRIGRPDTDADIALRNCLDQQSLTSFIMVAGAGSGKTTSLVKALGHLSLTKGPELRRCCQQIACITYTEVAVGEIWGDVGNDSLFHVSTIHSFIWKIVRPFQQDIRVWIAGRIEEKIKEAQEKIDSPRTRSNTKLSALQNIERYRGQYVALSKVVQFNYGTGSDYARGILGHDDILKLGTALIEDHSLLRELTANRFPFIFVDESQDTNPDIVSALKKINDTVKVGFCLGFFGDPMQKIYTTGAGQIVTGEGWRVITKPENFRCPQRVLEVVNKIRAEDDGLQQIQGRTIELDGVIERVDGTARLFILPSDESRTERVVQVRDWLAVANDDPHWKSDENDSDVRVLVLVHRMAARRLGFPNLYAALNDDAPPILKDGLLDGTAWVFRPFLKFLLPLVVSARAGNDFEVIAALRVNCPHLSKERIAGQNVADMLCRLQDDVLQLVAMFASDSNITIRQTLEFVRARELVNIDERFAEYLDNPDLGVDESDENKEAQSVSSFLSCMAVELWGYQEYIEDHSPFATQQGVKGAEFSRVMVILDDEEGSYNLFSYGKYFGITQLSETDHRNITEGSDSVIGRTRRLFYVCCSRAVLDLAVIFFVPNVDAARSAIDAKGFFRNEDIYELEDLQA